MSEKLDRFSKRARHALTLAKEEATRLHHRQIDTEHLLLGLLAEKEGLAMRALVALGCDTSIIRQRIEERTGEGRPARWPWGQATLADGVKRVIELAVGAARETGHQYIGTEHLLVGLLEEGQGIGATVLREFVAAEDVVHKISELTTKAASKPKRSLTADEYLERIKALTFSQDVLVQSWAGEDAVQAERNRLARDLHDSVKQQLFSISISAAAVRERLEKDPVGALAALADVQQSAQAAMVEIDALLHQLSPAPLATIGLIEALQEQCEALGYRTGATVTTTFGTLPPTERLPTGTQEAIFRMAQEVLSNVARHARASAVHVQMELVADENLLRLEVQDNGQGFTPTTKATGMGLANLRVRAIQMLGRVELDSTPGQGTRVRIDIPLIRQPGAAKEQGDEQSDR